MTDCQQKNGVLHWMRCALKRNLALATTFKILVFSIVIALVISVASFFLIQYQQQAIISANIKQLAKTVQTTASIASFTHDAELAKEVVNGLLNNNIVNSASITTDKKLVFAKGAFSKNLDNMRYRHALFSPFDASTQVGELQIEANPREIFKQSYQYAQLISIGLFVLIVVISFTLSLVINLNIIQPIQKVAETLHAMDAQDLTDIPLPKKHAQDEIGRLVMDINLLTQQQKSLLKSEQLLREAQAQAQKRIQLIFEKNSNGLFIADQSLNLSIWNSALEKVLMCDIPQHQDALPNLIQLLQTHASRLLDLLQRVIHQQTADSVILHCVQGQHEAWVDITLQMLDEQHLQGIVSDVTAHKRSEMLALSMAEKDALTGLFNRRGFELQLLQKISACTTQAGIALLMIDLDGFKAVNDSCGHDAGDYVLKEVARRLQHVLRANEVIARLGGDEFAVIISGLMQASDVEPIAQKLVDLIKNPMHYAQKDLTVGASIGVSFTCNRLHGSKSLLKQADSAMYHAKNAGKGRFYLYAQHLPNNDAV